MAIIISIFSKLQKNNFQHSGPNKDFIRDERKVFAIL